MAPAEENLMANVQWQISGEYCEACSCDSVCPCPTSGLAARPTKGYCDAGLVFRVDRGQYGSTRLDGLSFAVLLHTPGPMIQGNWTIGLVVDERASKEQHDALRTIASGHGGGPMAALAPLISNFGGTATKPITFQMNGMRRSVSIPGMATTSTWRLDETRHAMYQNRQCWVRSLVRTAHVWSCRSRAILPRSSAANRRRQAALGDLLEQRLVADLENPRGLGTVPAYAIEHFEERLALGVSRPAAPYLSQALRGDRRRN